MAAEVSSLGRVARGYKEDGGGGGGDGKQELVARDLFRADSGLGDGGGGGGAGAAMGSPVVGWKRGLDLLSYLQQNDSDRFLQDLNLPPPSPPPPPAAAWTGSAPSVYQSACTLDKVKSALERESRLGAASNTPASPSTSCTTTITSSSSSIKRRSPPPAATDDDDGAAMMVVGGCPVCLMFVLVSTADPSCPKCGAQATVRESSGRGHQKTKRPRIDLNFTVEPSDE